MGRMVIRIGPVAAVLLLTVAACAPLSTTTPSTPPDLTTPVQSTSTLPAQEEPMPQPDLTASPIVQQAMADLAERLGVDPAEITVVRVEEVDWPDGSLGCPQPGMLYTQALVNGSFIQLQVDNQTYNYHSGGARPPLLCTSKDEVLPEDLPDSLRGDPDL